MSLFIAIQLLIWISFLFYSIDTFFEIFLCNPRQKIWNLLITDGHCFDQTAAYMATGIFNVVSDFAILVLPIWPVWKLQMPRRKKIMISAIFATGIWYVLSLLLLQKSKSTQYAAQAVES